MPDVPHLVTSWIDEVNRLPRADPMAFPVRLGYPPAIIYKRGRAQYLCQRVDEDPTQATPEGHAVAAPSCHHCNAA
jgi:hypothetical protein